MFSPDMSRSLASWVFTLVALAGCTVTQPVPVVDAPPDEIIAYSALRHWLNLQQEVASMPAEEVVATRIQLKKPEGAGQLFYVGLLNQQLQTFDAWVQARDAFRELQQNEELTGEQRQLAVILQQYNQNRINWYHRQSALLKRHAELQQQMQETEQEKLLLEQKIQALTDLEEAISTRKEQ